MTRTDPHDRSHGLGCAAAQESKDAEDSGDGIDISLDKGGLEFKTEDWHWVGEVDFAANLTVVKDFTVGDTGLSGVASVRAQLDF